MLWFIERNWKIPGSESACVDKALLQPPGQGSYNWYTHFRILIGEQVKAFLRKYTTKTTSITAGDGGHKSEGLQPQRCFNTLTATLSDALSSNTCFLVFDTSNSDPHHREIIAGMFSAGQFLSSHGIEKFLNVNHMNAMFKIVKLKGKTFWKNIVLNHCLLIYISHKLEHLFFIFTCW